MRTETTYISDDGTEFESEEECRQYEENFYTDMSCVVFLDDEFRVIGAAPYDPSKKLFDIEDYAFYAYIKDAERAKALFGKLPWLISISIPECSYRDGDTLAIDDHGDWSNLKTEEYALMSRRIKAESAVLEAETGTHAALIVEVQDEHS